MNRQIPPITTVALLLSLLLVAAMQIWFLATSKSVGYLIGGYILLMGVSAATTTRILLWLRRR